MQPEKKTIMNALLQRINSSPFLLVADYHGLTTGQFGELRRQLRETGASCHVTKNTYMKRAVVECGLPEDLSAAFTGQTAIITGEEDVCAAAKILKAFHKQHARPQIKLGVLDGKLLEEDAVQKLADLPSREQILSQFLGLLQAPATNLVRLVNEPGTRVARVMKARSEQAS